MDTLEFFVSSAIALIAVVISSISLWRSWRIEKVQRQLNEINLQKELNAQALSKQAEIRVEMLNYGSGGYRVELSNAGYATAKNVNLSFPDGNDLVIDSELKTKLPFHSLSPGRRVELIAAVHLGTPNKHRVLVSWEDGRGTSVENEEFLIF